jgi:hypothetical protein
VIGAEDIVDYTQKPDLLKRIGDRIGVVLARAATEVLSSGTGQIR